MTQTIAVPGQLLGPADKYVAGSGTHIHESNLYSSLLGTVSVSHPPAPEKAKAQQQAPAGPAKRLHRIAALQQQQTSSSSSNGRNTQHQQQQTQALPTISVLRAASSSSSSSTSPPGKERREVLPEVNNVVLCRVTRITPRQATVAILVVGDTVLEAEWQGLIRVQDVRATEKDRVKIYESFRPGDIVRAQVISLGDQANYYLSTASNELGVIMATSEAGNTMYPVSWKEYKDPETGLGESRKVAKPF
ncbi:hypothetical protein F5X99DRAFT_409402 [Biscogniauxia marginata]|nr:hypothetical protein F5X99DRAFT_409402 [Biscogniauxia marginata]